MTKLFNDVRDFNRACDVRMRVTPGWVPDEDIELALRLVDEEANELLAAIQDRDMVETADAVADSLYVLAGFALRLGVARIFTPDLLPPPTPQSFGPPSWDAYGILPELLNQISVLHERLREAVLTRNLNATDTTLHSLMYSYSTVARGMGIPLREVWDEVQRSNMAKVVDGKVVRDPHTGKVLKPEGWTAPDIAAVLDDYGWAA